MSMDEKLVVAFFCTALPVLALGSWAVAYKFAGKNAPSVIHDLRELFTESLPFLKTQWLFLAICTVGSGVSACQLSQTFDLAPAYYMVSAVTQGIVPVLKLFYVAYLAAPRNAALIATIGIKTMIFYLIGEYIQTTAIALGIALLVFPGLYIMARTSLFLPIYAVEGHRPLHALERSWAITKGKYWPVCLYLGPTFVIVLLGHCLPSMGIMLQHHTAARPLIAAVSAVSGMTSTLLDIMLAGLMYKLYLRFSEPAAESPAGPAAGPVAEPKP